MPDTTYPTHVDLDGAVHKIALVEEHADGPGHTHRVHLGCGMTIDVDVGGIRANARSLERLAHVQNERDQGLKAMHVELHTTAAASALANGETWTASRWKVDAKANGCLDCTAHETGAAAKIMMCNHSRPTTRQADVDTSVACPTCGARVYKRRSLQPGEAEYACSGQGHEFSGLELMENIKRAVERLTALVK